LLRWLLRLVDVSLSLGVVAMATISASQKGQRLGDIAAGTAVVSTRQRQTLRDTALPATEETYTPLYPEAVRLSDRDVSIIKEALQAYHQGDEQDSWLIQSLAEKVQGLLGTRTQQTYVEFLRTVIKDHAHLTR
ncbi:MAG TPA: RDD family protein, partial [Cytophagales bacterium]